ncbi:MAG: citrate synthase/methylcitrate synthase, partial [Alphaproteobacteria bacterium HGW-Alphaproteobacteria-12]
MSETLVLKSETPRVSASGLDNVVAAETALSHVDGEAGRLIVAGYEVEDLVKAHDFEGAAAALWAAAGLEPAPSEGDVREALGRAREAAYGYIPALLSSKCHRTVTEGLRTGLSMLADEPDRHAVDRDIPAHIRALGAAAVMTAALVRAEAGKSPVAPDARAGHAEDFLRMLRDEAPSAAEVEALNAYLVTVADHGMNASTFTARVIASTRAG